MTTAFGTGSQCGIYELFNSQPVCELVFMHYILCSHFNNGSAHAHTCRCVWEQLLRCGYSQICQDAMREGGEIGREMQHCSGRESQRAGCVFRGVNQGQNERGSGRKETELLGVDADPTQAQAWCDESAMGGDDKNGGGGRGWGIFKGSSVIIHLFPTDHEVSPS